MPWAFLPERQGVARWLARVGLSAGALGQGGLAFGFALGAEDDFTSRIAIFSQGALDGEGAIVEGFVRGDAGDGGLLPFCFAVAGDFLDIAEEEDFALLRLLVVATQQVGDGSEEGGEIRVAPARFRSRKESEAIWRRILKNLGLDNTPAFPFSRADSRLRVFP